jgi:EAL domain-containing protein (putative c-di-GMP-specific phosphodiesterase class I)/GGDEF domain-containing protein
MKAEKSYLHLDSLNRAFEKAFAHSADKETLEELLECIGGELSCDRIAIFEILSDGTCDNTYEWCREGAEHVRELFQHVAVRRFDPWLRKMKEKDYLQYADISTLKEEDPDVYMMLRAQKVHSVIASRLAFHGKEIGFFLMENPGEEVLAESACVMPGLRYILSSLVYSDCLIRKLQRLGYLDRLTGLSNRSGLAEVLDSLDHTQSFGLVYCEVVGLRKDTEELRRIREEQAFIRTGEILSSLFGATRVFNLAPGEMLAVAEGTEEESFRDMVEIMNNLFREHDLLAAVGSLWQKNVGKRHDALIRQVHMHAHDQARELARRLSDRRRSVEEELFDERERASISLYRNDDFFRHASEKLAQIIDEQIMTIVVDLNYFKLYNDIFGRKAGNLFLESIAAELQRTADECGGIAGYLGGDNFCLVVPVRGHTEETLKPLINQLVENVHYPDGFAPAFGIYLSESMQESLVAMYDHALSALAEIKGSYIEHYRFYDADHFRRDRDAKLLLMDVKKGLPEGEFLFFVQPQVNDRTGRIVGAEALVRWQCKGQMLHPGQFVPALEKSGYIYAVDSYIWEAVIKWLRSLEERGINQIPVSVNVSRVDFYFADIAEQFISLTGRYGLNPALLGIEITESAFTDNTETIRNAVTKLHDAGFRVLMDDFGSGSSSLSMLHMMNLDVLKTDVAFMSRKDSDNKAISIVESVVSMAHMIGMTVITEGVETERQKENLIAIGDNYVQGFYFYEPMPVEQFEQLLMNRDNLEEAKRPGSARTENHLKFRELIREGMMSETLLDNLIGAAAVFKMENGNLSIVQINRQYEKVTQVQEDDDAAKALFAQKLLDRNRDTIHELIRIADTHPFDGTIGDISVETGSGIKVMKSRIFPLYSCDSHSLYFTTLE